MDTLVHSSCSQEHWLLRLTAESFRMSCLLLKETVLSKVIPPSCRQTTSITSWTGVQKLWPLDSAGILKSYTSFQTPLRISWSLLCNFSLSPILLSSSLTGIASQPSQWTFCLQISVSFPEILTYSIRHIVSELLFFLSIKIFKHKERLKKHYSDTTTRCHCIYILDSVFTFYYCFIRCLSICFKFIKNTWIFNLKYW